MNPIEAMHIAIRQVHRCFCKHVESALVVLRIDGETVWDGTVEIFDLIGHPKAKRAYAWTHQSGGQNTTVAVLELPPVYSPQTAIAAALAAEGRQEYPHHR